MKYLLPALAVLFFWSAAAHAAEILPPEIRISDSSGTIQKTLPELQKKMIGGLSIAVGDLGNDGIAEIVAGSGIGSEPKVSILRQDGSVITAFLAYAQNFGGGVRVALGDVDGDGVNEIITGAGYSGGPHIRIFDSAGQPKYGFFAYDPAFRGGVFVTARDLDGDGSAEIITGSGPTGGPHVKIFTADGSIKNEFFAFSADDRSGVTVGTGDINHDGSPEILVARASSDPPELGIFSASGLWQKTLLPYDVTFRGGITAQGADCNGDGWQDILVATNGVRGELKCISASDGAFIKSYALFPADFTGSVQFAWAPLSTAEHPSLIAAASRAYREGNIEEPQAIRVSINEQRLYAYEHGILINTFLISSGLYRYPTPTGNFFIQRKIPIKDYVWSYGPGNPNNYALYNVKWNLQFRPGYYLHYAYWHNNFGNRMSHGCVNMPRAESEWIYNWAKENIPVRIQ
ncbi:MAG: L,D-transpeptidase family protein [bacterium]|nr:L,D-transpeptidase family protein [bacterium]